MESSLNIFVGLLARRPLLTAETRWKTLVSWDKSFELIRNAVLEARKLPDDERTRHAQLWTSELENWAKYRQVLGSSSEDDYVKLARLVSCAVSAIVDVPGTNPIGSGWDDFCRRAFLATRTRVPIALVDSERGCMGELELSLLDGETCAIYQHPLYALHSESQSSHKVSIGREFEDSMKVACDAARSLFEQQTRFDGAWRLINPTTDTTITSVEGASAGLAAVRGWWHALSSKIPDPAIVVIGQVLRLNTGFLPCGLPGDEALVKKLEMIRADARFDTCVLVDDVNDNVGIAARVLKGSVINIERLRGQGFRSER
jgi:hypothetical protein